MEFRDWFKQLEAIAQDKGMLWAVGERDSHYEAYKDGCTPEEELDLIIETAVEEGKP